MRHLFAALFAIASLAVAVVLAQDPAAASDTDKSPHKLTGQYVEFCSCERFCETAVSEGARRAGCSFIAGLKVEAGQRGEISLGGLFAAIVAPRASQASEKPTPGPILYMDPAATPAQSEALRAFLSDQFAVRAGGPFGPPRVARIEVVRNTEALSVSIEGVADLRARPIYGPFRRGVQLENAPGTFLPFPMLGRGTAGQLVDATAGIRFDGEGRSVLYGKFDFGGKKAGKR